MTTFLHFFAMLLCLSSAFPQYWVNSPGDDGGCGVLVSNRLNDDGMLGNGYAVVEPDGIATSDGEGGWSLPSPSPSSGWFYTAEAGKLSGAGNEDSSCPDLFLSSDSPLGDSSITWKPPVDAAGEPIAGTYTVEGAYAQSLGQISYFSLKLVVDSSTSSPPVAGLSPPLPGPNATSPSPPPPLGIYPPPSEPSTMYASPPIPLGVYPPPPELSTMYPSPPAPIGVYSPPPEPSAIYPTLPSGVVYPPPPELNALFPYPPPSVGVYPSPPAMAPSSPLSQLLSFLQSLSKCE